MNIDKFDSLPLKLTNLYGIIYTVADEYQYSACGQHQAVGICCQHGTMRCTKKYFYRKRDHYYG